MPHNKTTSPRTIKPETVTPQTTTSQKAKPPTASRPIIRRITSARARTRTATKRFIVASSALALLLILASATHAQDSKLIATGQQQLVTARVANTEEAYRLAESTFEQAVKLDPKAAMARTYLGLARMELSGWIARQGRFDSSGEVMNKAIADLDAAVAMAPDNLQVRMLRGSSYAEFPSFLNKGSLAREDLETVVHHPNFAAQSSDTRARVYFTLGRVMRRRENLRRREHPGRRLLQPTRRLAKARRRNGNWKNLGRRSWPRMSRDAGCRIAFPTFLWRLHRLWSQRR